MIILKYFSRGRNNRKLYHSCWLACLSHRVLQYHSQKDGWMDGWIDILQMDEEHSLLKSSHGESWYSETQSAQTEISVIFYVFGGNLTLSKFCFLRDFHIILGKFVRISFLGQKDELKVKSFSLLNLDQINKIIDYFSSIE